MQNYDRNGDIQSTTSSASESSRFLSIRRLYALTFFARSLSGLQCANENCLLQPAAGHLRSPFEPPNVAVMAAAENECPQAILWSSSSSMSKKNSPSSTRQAHVRCVRVCKQSEGKGAQIILGNATNFQLIVFVAIVRFF